MTASRIIIASSVLIAGLSLAACGGNLNLPVPAPAPASPSAPAVSPGFFSGDTNDVPVQVAQRFGCTDISADVHLDNYVDSEVSCLYNGDNDVNVYAFASSTREQSWFALGPESADDSGTVILGTNWAVEPYNPGQATAIAHIIGGTIRTQ